LPLKISENERIVFNSFIFTTTYHRKTATFFSLMSFVHTTARAGRNGRPFLLAHAPFSGGAKKSERPLVLRRLLVRRTSRFGQNREKGRGNKPEKSRRDFDVLVRQSGRPRPRVFIASSPCI
jgi:hypothetical protein